MKRTEKFSTIGFWLIIDAAAAWVAFDGFRYGILYRDAWSIGWAAVLIVIALGCTYAGLRSLRRKDKGRNAAA